MPHEQVIYRQATRQDVAQIGRMTAASFGSYPFFDFALRDAFGWQADYARYMERLHRVHARAFMRRHVCLVGQQGDRLACVAILQDPSAKPPGVWDYICEGGPSLAFPVGPARILRFLSLCGQAEQDCLREHPDAWYLEMIAVNASAKSQGLGSAMLRDCVLPHVARQGGRELTLITNTPGNCAFYEKNGFHEFARRTHERGEQQVTTWSFCRQVGAQDAAGTTDI